MTFTKTVASASDDNVQVVDLTAEEILIFETNEKAWTDGATDRAWKELRQERNAKLAASDWMATSDYTMSDPWKTYRQALRDLPANTDDPANPTWPEEPS
tara:strand:- start:6 stop:305 length:300 start_codon:yes stop_codon:yes gene_type:complete